MRTRYWKRGGTGACSDAPAWLIFYDITIPKQNVRPELNKTKSMLRNIVKFTASLPNVLWEILTHQRSSSPDISLLLPISISSTRPTGSSFLTAALHRHAHPPSLNECDKIGFWVPWGCFRGWPHVNHSYWALGDTMLVILWKILFPWPGRICWWIFKGNDLRCCDAREGQGQVF